jgi:hypothetical protein
MKWIKTREQWLNEARIKDIILPKQAKAVAQQWGEKYLDYEEVDPTDKIKQGRWKLEEEDKLKVLSYFFDCNMENIMNSFTSIPDKFNHVLQESINLELLTDASKMVMDNFNIQAPTVDQIVFIYEPVFRKLEIRETQASERIQKDENGRPIRDEEGNMIRVKKNAGDPVFSTNLININSFVDDYNRCYPDDRVSTTIFSSRDISQLRNLAKENHNSDYRYEYAIFGRDIYLQIDHNPSDILNMSISKFYSSCQHLYTGGYREQLLGNVFDPNSIPAFFVFDTPIFWNDEKISDKLPLSRMMIRNIESFDDQSEAKIYFDRAYPDRMKDIFDELVTKYSSNVENTSPSSSRYLFTPDIDPEDSIRAPYMDRMRLDQAQFIGKNTKSLYLSAVYDWSKIKISPKAKIKQLVIETTDIPENLTQIPLDLEWIKFKSLKIKTLSGFSNVKTDSIAFDKCKFDSKIFEEIVSVNPNIKKLQILSCDMTGDIDLSIFTELEELQILYTLDTLADMKEGFSNLKVKKLVISGDLIVDKQTKEYVSELRRSGIKVEIVGPQI